MKPLISIIIPTYNGEKFIDKTIKSCLNQTYENIEIIIINDNSKDNTEKIIYEFLYDQRIKYIKNKRNLGIVKNVNMGYRESKGKYVISLGHDDVLKPNHLEIMYDCFERNTSFVFCNSELIDENGNFIKNMFDETKILAKLKNPIFEFSKENFINSCGAMVNKEKAFEVGLWEEFDEFPHYGEWYFWVKLATVGQVKYCDKIKSQYRRHSTNITNTFKDKEVIKKLNKFKNICRKFAYSKGDFTFKQKINFYLYYIKANLKDLIKYLIAR